MELLPWHTLSQMVMKANKTAIFVGVFFCLKTYIGDNIFCQNGITFNNLPCKTYIDKIIKYYGN